MTIKNECCKNNAIIYVTINYYLFTYYHVQHLVTVFNARCYFLWIFTEICSAFSLFSVKVTFNYLHVMLKRHEKMWHIWKTLKF